MTKVNANVKPNELTFDLISSLAGDIKEFRTTFGLPCDGLNYTQDSQDLHTSLYLEEITEFGYADTLVEQADAIVDSVYVLMGHLVHAGFEHDVSEFGLYYQIDTLLSVAKAMGINFQACWDNIHASNMSKVCADMETAERTQAFYAEKGIEVGIFLTGEYFVIKCIKEFVSPEKTIKVGKVLKSVDYTPADLSDIVKLK